MKLTYVLIIVLAAIITTYSIITLPHNKDPYAILNNASLKTASLSSYYIITNTSISMSYFGIEAQQSAESLIAIKEGRFYVRSEVNSALLNYHIINELFSIESGDFNCLTSALVNGTFCVSIDETSFDDVTELPESYLALADQSLISLTFEGKKVINNARCDLIRITFNEALLNSSDLEGLGLPDSFTDYSSSMCLDQATGLPVYVVWEGSDTSGDIMISQTITNFSLSVPDDLFILPSEPISEEEFELLFNSSIA